MERFLEGGMHWRFLNFFLFVGILAYFLRRPVKEFWKARAHKIRFDLGEAAKLRAAEEKNYRDLSRRVAAIEQEVAGLIQDLKEEGELEKSRLIAAAEDYSEKLKVNAQKIASQEVAKAKARLTAEAVRLSVELAESLIREKIGPADQKRLEEGAIGRLEGTA